MLTKIQIACMTAKTRKDYDGATIPVNDRSIHWNRNWGHIGKRRDGGNIAEPRRERPASGHKKRYR